MGCLSDTNPTADWSYLSEGGSSIVFSYTGPLNPFFDGTVLRLRKCALNDDNDEQYVSDEPDPTVEFHQRCIARLIPQAHLTPRLEAVAVGPGAEAWLGALATQCESSRPLDRRQRDHIDVKRPRAVLATDLIGWQGIVVEIKPKWGFLPSPTYLSEATRPLKTRTCRFCMHAWLRAQRGETAILGYCPLDLYSGDELRIKNALDNLWDAWKASDGSVNNLKIFVHGKRISPAEQESTILDALHADTNPKEALVSALLPILLDTPVLRILSRLQRSLDALDIEGLASLLHHDYTSAGADPTISEWAAFVSAYPASPPPPADAAHLRHHVLAYLLSATFKDCSIILRVPAGSVRVIDLDLKGIDRLPKWGRMDQEIVEAYAQVLEPKHCVDSPVLE